MAGEGSIFFGLSLGSCNVKHIFHAGLGIASSFFFLALWPNIEYYFAKDLELWTVSKNILILLLGSISFLKMRGRARLFLSFYSGAVLFCIIWLMIFTPHVVIISDEEGYGMFERLEGIDWWICYAVEWLKVIDWWIYYSMACLAGCLVGGFSDLIKGRKAKST